MVAHMYAGAHSFLIMIQNHDLAFAVGKRTGLVFGAVNARP